MTTGIDVRKIIKTEDPRFLDEIIRTAPGLVREYEVELRHTCFRQPLRGEDDSAYLQACAAHNINPYSTIAFRPREIGHYETITNSVGTTRMSDKETVTLDADELATGVQHGKAFYELAFRSHPAEPAHYTSFRDQKYPELCKRGYGPWRVTLTLRSHDADVRVNGTSDMTTPRWNGWIEIHDRHTRDESLMLLQWGDRLVKKYHNR